MWFLSTDPRDARDCFEKAPQDREELKLAPFIGIACLGVIATVRSSNWESSEVHLPASLVEAHLRSDTTKRPRHDNDGVVQTPSRAGRESEGRTETIGSGLGAARFADRHGEGVC
ncbi:hypothetical protein ABIF26_005462 [Bradyrhizobium elkanii]|uniref:hypothetical protein n=1 Tax=Bradyrhizobium elkanii TaxID=29448 RepID=UPI00351580A5